MKPTGGVLIMKDLKPTEPEELIEMQVPIGIPHMFLFLVLTPWQKRILRLTSTKKPPHHPRSNTSAGTNRSVSTCMYSGGVSGGMVVQRWRGGIDPDISNERGGVLSFGGISICRALYPQNEPSSSR